MWACGHGCAAGTLIRNALARGPFASGLVKDGQCTSVPNEPVSMPLGLAKRLGAPVVPAVFAILLFFGAPAPGHGPERVVNRQIVRLQGYRATPPADVKVVREIILVVHGKEQRFWAMDWRRFGVEQPSGVTPVERERLNLRADFADAARFTNARGDQRITILAEQRPGSADLFVLALDLCPP